MTRAGHFRHLLAVTVAVAGAAASSAVLTLATSSASGVPPVIIGYVPLPADDLVTALRAVNASANTTLDFTVGVTNAGAGAVLTYDHWEDGFESDMANPTQTTTKVWGDGNATNGDAAAVCSVCSGDLVPQGAVFVLRNNLTTPRNTSSVLYDGRDKIGSTRGFALTASGWTTPLGSVLASAVSAYDRTKYGTAFVVPVGQNTTVRSGASPAFAYTGASIMAAYPGTTVSVDLDGNGVSDSTVTLGEGQAHLVNGGLLEGARITSSKPVQVDLITGDIGATYESRSFFLFPTDLLTDDYVSPVGSSVANQETVIYLHNPGSATITITPTCPGCSGTLSVPAHGTVSFPTPSGKAVHFASAGGATFSAIGANGAESGAFGASSDASATYDWGFTLVPTRMLTTQVVLGWAPGNSALPPSAADDDPVWVSSMADTTVRIDLDGDPATGALGPDCYGKHDSEIAVTALTSNRLTDTTDKDMTGARIYTCDGTALVGAWGEDPANAPAGSPGLDAGYTLIPSTAMVVDKTAAVQVDDDGDGLPGPGDTLEYRVLISDAGSLAFTGVQVQDPLGSGMTYVPGSTVLIDGGTTTPIADDTVPPAATVMPMDEAPIGLPTLGAGASYELRYRVVLDPSYAPGGSVTNSVTVTANEGRSYDRLVTPLATNDLSVAVSQTASPVAVGDGGTFSITVANAGPDLAAGTVVHVPLPAGASYTSSSTATGTYDHTSGDWTVGTLASGASATLTLNVTLTSTTVTAYAEVTAASGSDVDSQPAENAFGAGHAGDQDDESSASVAVAPRIDLELTKVVTTGPALDGTIVFRLTLLNRGPSTATNITVADLPAPGTTDVSAAVSSGTFNPGTHTWSVASLAAGASVTLDLTQVVGTLPSTHLAQVTAATQTDVDSQPAEDALGQAAAPNQDDEASVLVTATSSAAGAVWLDLDHDGVRDAGEPGLAGVTVTLVYAGADTTFGTGDDVSWPLTTAGDGSWSRAALAAGSYTATVSPGTLPLGATEPTADLDGIGTPQLAAFSLTAGVPRNDVHFGEAGTARLSGVVFLDADGDHVFSSSEAQAGVPVHDHWAGPDGTFDTADDTTTTTVTAADGSWTFASVPSGPHRITVDRSALPSGHEVVVDPDATLDGITTLVLIAGELRSALDVGVRVAVSKNVGVQQQIVGEPVVGGDVEVRVAVTNTGTDVNGPITVVDTLPTGLQFVSGGNDGWSCGAEGQVVTCVHGGPLAAGQTTTFPIVTKVLAAGVMNNVVTVNVAGDIQPSDDVAAAEVQAGSRLPRTGAAETSLLLRLATGFVVFGVAEMVLSRRRRRPSVTTD